MTRVFLFFILFGVCPFINLAQNIDSLMQQEEDYSMYDNAEVVSQNSTPRYCTSKILGGSPSKLISIGYDYQLPYTITSGVLPIKNIIEETTTINSTQGWRFSANIPIISNTKWLISLGANYWNVVYDFKTNPIHPFSKTLAQNSLTTSGLNTTIFKPINGSTFILAQAAGDWSSNLSIGENFTTEALRISGALVYGWKKHDRKQFGVGISRTYRAGEVNILPVLLYNYTYPNRKVGYEMLLPARAAVRYTANSRNILLFGYELEGNSFYLKNIDSLSTKKMNVNFRKSELRFRLTYDFSVYKFLWLSIQAGYRIGYLYNVDEGEFFRGFTGDQPYLLENKIQSAPYVNISLNLVSP
ncbi:MAG: hypothetical protein J0M08_05325 [Bacteroidetes bacterium]|nr:hypothetical protein [Bacteroidota bacterium]